MGEFWKPEAQKVEKATCVIESHDDAKSLVKEFWQAMSHGTSIFEQGEREQDYNWGQELTMGDRTVIVKGHRENKGKWIVLFTGNHQPLSSEAVAWLKEKGIISE